MRRKIGAHGIFWSAAPGKPLKGAAAFLIVMTYRLNEVTLTVASEFFTAEGVLAF